MALSSCLSCATAGVRNLGLVPKLQGAMPAAWLDEEDQDFDPFAHLEEEGGEEDEERWAQQAAFFDSEDLEAQQGDGSATPLPVDVVASQEVS